MYRKLRAFICLIGLMAILAGILGGCAKASSTKEKKQEVNKEKKIVVGCSFVSKDNQWWATVGKFTEQAAKKLDCEVIILWANGNQEKQINDVEDLIQRKVDVILLGPVQQSGSMVAVDAAYKAGIPVVTIARKSDSPNVTAGIIAKEKQFGINQALQVAKDFPNGANIVYLFGPVGAGYAIQQYEGFIEELKKHPNLKLLYKYEAPVDTSAEGMKNAEDALVRFKDIDAICATNDDQALGAVRAVEAAGKVGKIRIYGGSALPMGMQAIYDGKMHFTQLKSQSQMALKALELAVKVAKGEKVDKENFLEPVVITKENVTNVVDAVFGGTLDAPETWKPGKQ